MSVDELIKRLSVLTDEQKLLPVRFMTYSTHGPTLCDTFDVEPKELKGEYRKFDNCNGPFVFLNEAFYL